MFLCALPRVALSAEGLQAELDREARTFLADERNLRIDPEAGTVFLSAIFDWYDGDFIRWQKSRHPEAPATLTGYVRPHLSRERQQALDRCNPCRIRFEPYDWGLNDRARKPMSRAIGVPTDDDRVRSDRGKQTG